MYELIKENNSRNNKTHKPACSSRNDDSNIISNNKKTETRTKMKLIKILLFNSEMIYTYTTVSLILETSVIHKWCMISRERERLRDSPHDVYVYIVGNYEGQVSHTAQWVD